jgi:AraC-like DNA-binding protein
MLNISASVSAPPPGLMDKLAAMLATTSGEGIRVLGYRRDLACADSDAVSAPQEAYLVLLHLRPCKLWSLRVDGRETAEGPIPEGAFTVHDLRRRQAVRFDGPIQLVGVHIPCAVLKSVAASLGRSEDLPHVAGRAYCDAQVRDLSRFLRVAAARAMGHPHPFIDSLAQAICARIIEHAPDRLTGPRGGLAPWQERRAKEILESDCGGMIRLEALAQTCRLSASHFARAFKQSTGASPRRWRAKVRIEKAKLLLEGQRLSLAQIGCDCGFSDQSHFTRTFTEIVGVPPGRWRRALIAPEGV